MKYIYIYIYIYILVLRAPRYNHIIVLRLLVVNGGGIAISGYRLPPAKLYDP